MAVGLIRCFWLPPPFNADSARSGDRAAFDRLFSLGPRRRVPSARRPSRRSTVRRTSAPELKCRAVRGESIVVHPYFMAFRIRDPHLIDRNPDHAPTRAVHIQEPATYLFRIFLFFIKISPFIPELHFPTPVTP